ncbi:MAG: CPBP family intramembrane metalloprotease [Lachnospiraceae bacterium]|nr:CPBP family intramembrane metalloprotease [Lachnospiraceae bacterium]
MQNRSRLAGRQYLAMMAVWLIAGLLVSVIRLDRFLSYYSSHSLVELELLVPAVVLLVMDRFEVMRGTRMKAIGIKVILWALLLSVILLPITNFLNLLSQLFVPNNIVVEIEHYTLLTGTVVWDRPLLLNLFYMAVMPAVVEEFLFRGVLYQGFRSCGLLKTAVITSLMFALAHGNLNQFLYAFVIGLFLAYLVEASGSVYASMLAHMCLNGVSVALVYIEKVLPENITSALVEAENTSVHDLSLVYWIIYGVITGACIVLAIIVVRTIAKVSGRELIYKEARKGHGRLKGKEGRVFSVELLIGLMIPIIYIAFMLLAELIRS